MKTILIVDDDPDFAAALSGFLRASGFRVLEARDGAEGLRLARTQRPDLIIMDIVMSERTEGFFTLQQLRATDDLQHIPVFVASSLYAQYPEFTIPPDRAWLAHDAFFPKPVDMPALLAAIRRRLGIQEEPG